MATQHSFNDIFNTSIDGNVRITKIIIPIIQRDYAQGRKDYTIDRVRKRFLQALYDAVIGEPIVLDFVYGDVGSNGVMTPLDGQQRLTTLFLLYWYAAQKDRVADDEKSFLSCFSYETRPSSRSFCEKLINTFTPSFSIALSDEIIDQSWFPSDWKKDPTISSMLVMLDAINDKFGDVCNLWKILTEDHKITFYFLPIKDMGLTDEIYIKMNSRGKPLTMFEQFKAELERNIKELNPGDENICDRISSKIDKDWTDLIWKYREGNTNFIIDGYFLNYFKFICDIICYKAGESIQNRINDPIDLLDSMFSPECKTAQENIKTLEDYFDCWVNLNGCDSPSDFFTSFISLDRHCDGKIYPSKILSKTSDILEECFKGNDFSHSKRVFLYAVVFYLLHRDSVAWNDFVRRIRIISNLIQCSVEEIADRQDKKNRFPFILKQVENIILTGNIIDEEYGFNRFQREEEKAKIEFLENNPAEAEKLFELEDNRYLYGQIGIVGLAHLDYGKRFESLLECDLSLVDRALMTLGNYAQMDGKTYRFIVGSSSSDETWTTLFHKRERSEDDFNRTNDELIKLLDKSETFTDDILQEIVNEFLVVCETESRYPWEYYYIRYDAFRANRFGRLNNYNRLDNPYLYIVMMTSIRASAASYMPILKAALEKRDWDKLKYDRIESNGRYLACENNQYCIYNLEDVDSDENNPLEVISINHTSDFIDTENRIQLLKDFLYTEFFVNF